MIMADDKHRGFKSLSDAEKGEAPVEGQENKPASNSERDSEETEKQQA